MHLVEVKDSHTVRQFLEVNREMNQSNPCYISPLDNEVNEVFDPEKIICTNSEKASAGFCRITTGKRLGE